MSVRAGRGLEVGVIGAVAVAATATAAAAAAQVQLWMRNAAIKEGQQGARGVLDQLLV